MSGIKKWVLVAEDEEELRSLTVELLKLNFGDNLMVLEATNGLEATAKASCQAFDCIITDLRMPKKEGKAFIASARESQFNELTPIVVTSGFPDKTINRDFKFIYNLDKPFNNDDLVELIGTQLKFDSSKKRVAADLFNNIITATTKFLEAKMSTSTEVGAAKPHVRDASFEEQYCCYFEVKVGALKNLFAVMFKSELIRLISGDAYEDTEDFERRVCGAFGNSIFKYVLNKIGQDSFAGVKFLTLSPKELNSKLASQPGIFVPVKVSGSEAEIDIFASAN